VTIISHRHRCVFIAVPKNASHAIRFALRPFLDPADEEQVGLFLQKRIERPIFTDMRHGHQTALEVRTALGPTLWSDYRSFAVVRNPWARFVSYVAFMKRAGEWPRDPVAALWRTLRHPENQSAVHFRPQSDYLVDADRQLLVTQICRVEHLQADFDAVAAAIGLPPITLDLHNRSDHGHYVQYYDDAMVAAVAERYQEDIERFGYRFGD
jgi:hypothetical protein